MKSGNGVCTAMGTINKGGNSFNVVAVAVFCFMIFLGGCSSEESCQKVVTAKCIRCHSVATTCAKVGKSEARWNNIIDSMTKLGANVTHQERKTLAKCLSKPAGKKLEGVCQ